MAFIFRHKRLLSLFLSVSVACCSCLKFENDKVYQYTYITDTVFNNVNSMDKITSTSTDVGVQLTIAFDLKPLLVSADVQFVKIQITSAKYNSIARPMEEKDLPVFLKHPAFFELTGAGDTIEKVYVVDDDPVFSVNIKKGIMALFQLKDQVGDRVEIDVSGECQVTYSVPSANLVIKTKKHCQNLEIAGQFTSPNKVFGLTVWSKSTLNYDLQNGIIDKASGTTRIVSYLNIRTSLNGGAVSSQKLSLENTVTQGAVSVSSVDEAIKFAEKEAKQSLTVTLLPSGDEVLQCTDQCVSPKKLAENLHDDLVKEKLATVNSAKAFVQMVRSFRNSGKTTIAELFTSPDSYYIVPQLIDVAAAAQTKSSQDALMDLLSFEDDYAVDHPERYLFAAAYSTHPSDALLKDLLGVLTKNIPSESLRESLLLALAAITNTFCQIKENCKNKIVGEVRQLLVSKLEECGENNCRQMYLRALGNAGFPDTVSIILPYTELFPTASMLASTAINALRRIHKKFVDDKVKQAMLRIFHQTKAEYDTTVRTAALDMILKNEPALHVLQNILLTSLDQTNPEFSTYIVKSVFDAALAEPAIMSCLHTILQDPSFNNYNILSQKGKSSTLTNLLAKTADLNATYTMFIENSNTGIMKKSGMNIRLLGKLLRQPFMTFGIYAEGLESLLGESEEESGDVAKDDKSEVFPQIEPTAGMSFNLMDVLLRQIEFFRGSAGLMSAVWNAPSELTSALQGNLLLQDHFQHIHLSNGLLLEIEVLGVLSIDLSGYVSISLWNRNCQALIKNSGALYIEGTIRLDSSILQSGMVFSAEGESAIDFTTDAEFYQMPLTLCMQMMRPEFKFRQSFRRYENLKGIKRLRRQTRNTITVSAESYFLNKANSEECRTMKTDE